MNEEKRTILEMLAEGKITEAQATELLEALGDAEKAEPGAGAEAREEATPSITVNDSDGSVVIYPDGTIEVQEHGTGESMVIGGGSHKINLTLHPDHAELNMNPGEPGEIGLELDAEPAPPAMPAMPAPPEPPAPPAPGDPEDLERYIRQSQENNERYCREMNSYQQEMARLAEGYQREMEKLRGQAAEQRQAPPPPPKPPRPAGPTAGSWGSWFSGIGDEIRQGLREIGRELGRDLDDAMDDVAEAVSDLQDALGDVVEDWQEELAEEQEELAEAMEEAAEAASENDFLNFGSNFPFDEDDAGERVSPEGDSPEFENGEFVYHSWAALNTLEKLDVSWPTGKVRIAPWDGDHIEVREYSKKALGPDQRCVIFVKDSCKLTVWQYPKKQGLGIGQGLFGIPAKRLELLIPREQCGNIKKLRVQCTSSTLDVSSLSGETFSMSVVSGSASLQSIAAEVLDVSTVSGSLTSEGCSAEKLQLHTVSGTNSCKGFSAGKADLGTVSGTLKAHGNAEKFKVSTVSGSASLMVDQCPGKAVLHSVSGSLKLRLPENAGFAVDFNSMSGNFNSDFPAQITTNGKRKRSGRAVFGSGATKIEMHTTSGSMNVLKADGLSV